MGEGRGEGMTTHLVTRSVRSEVFCVTRKERGIVGKNGDFTYTGGGKHLYFTDIICKSGKF